MHRRVMYNVNLAQSIQLQLHFSAAFTRRAYESNGNFWFLIKDRFKQEEVTVGCVIYSIYIK